MSDKPKIKLLIPIEIKEGCELPECNTSFDLISKETGSLYQCCIFSDVSNKNVYSYPIRKHYKLNKFTHWLKEVETDLKIEELKKLGVI